MILSFIYQGRWFWNPVRQIKLKLACDLRQFVQQNHGLIDKFIDDFEVVLQCFPRFFSLLWVVLLHILKVAQAETRQKSIFDLFNNIEDCPAPQLLPLSQIKS